MARYVYFFGNGFSEAEKVDRMLLGGKGAGLHEMAKAGLPVPPGFTITTEVCSYYYKNNKTFPEGLREEVLENLRKIEEAKGQRFGDPQKPSPRLGKVGCSGFNARDDGHDPGPWAKR